MTSARCRRPGRILFVLQSVAVGGMETTAVDLAAELGRRGHAVQVIVPEDAALDPVAARCQAAGLPARRLTTDARSGGWIGARLLRFARLVRAWRPDVVHLHTGGATGGLGVIAVARACSRAAVVVTEHDVPTPAPPLQLRASAWLRDRVRHTLIAVARRNAGLRRERLPPPADRFAVVINGIPIRELEPAARAEARARLRRELQIADDVTAFGSVVRLAAGKGLHDLLRAFAAVGGERGCRLVLVGDGPLRGELEALAAELGVRERVRFAGYQREPLPYFAALDAFVLAVPAGSGSIALLEAMAAGLPPIITFCGPEEAVIHEETGLCAPPSDPPGLAAALQRLHDDPALRARLGAAAAAHVRRHFSIARVADDYLALYRAARRGPLPARLRADGPPTPCPGR